MADPNIDRKIVREFKGIYIKFTDFERFEKKSLLLQKDILSVLLSIVFETQSTADAFAELVQEESYSMESVLHLNVTSVEHSRQNAREAFDVSIT